jgi:hypothetical protein
MHAQSNQVLSDRTPSGLGVVIAGIAIAGAVAVGAVIGVNLAAKAVPLAGGYSLVTPSAAVDGTQDIAKGALSGKAEDQVLTPGFALPRNPGDIVRAPASGGAVTGPAYDNQQYLLTHPPIGSTFLDGADQRHPQAIAGNAAIMNALREQARLHGAPLVDSAARVEAQAVAVDAAIMQGLREAARLHGAPLVDAADRLKAQAVAENAAIMQGLREAAGNKSVEPLSLFASPYFNRIPTSAAITPDEQIRMAIAAAAQRANATASFPPASSTATYSQATDSLTGDPKSDSDYSTFVTRATRTHR